MSSVVEFRCPLSEFGLRSVIETASDVEVTVQRPVHAERADRTLLRIRNGEQRPITEALLEEPDVGDLELLGGSPHSHLYLVDGGFTDRLAPYVERGGVVETLQGRSEGWHLHALFPTREAVWETYDHLVERGRAPEIGRIYDLSATTDASTVRLDA